MSAVRPFSLVQSEDQWRRSAHEGTSIEGGAVGLAWELEALADSPDAESPVPGGLAFDPWCRLYRSLPDDGRLERSSRVVLDPLRPPEDGEAVDLLVGEAPRAPGDFSFGDAAPGVLAQPRGVAIDDDGRLYLAETGAGRILIFDLLEKRLLRAVRLGPRGAGGPRPLDLSTDGGRVFVVLDGLPTVVALDARTGPRAVDVPQEISDAGASRIAVSPGGDLYVLAAAGTAEARVLKVEDPDAPLAVPFATDIEFLDARAAGEHVLVVARRPGQDFLPYRITSTARDLEPQLKARGYDGRGIVRTPQNKIGFWTERGFRRAVMARRRFASRGRVTTFRLDSGRFQSVWGRVFIDACVPERTRVRMHCVTADDPPDEATLPRTPPANSALMEIHRPDLSPPMPPMSLVPGDGDVTQGLHRRESGRELPWARWAEDEPFETYEAPVRAAPGRYLWVTLELEGDGRATPKLQSLRVENGSHDLLRRLPKLFSRDENTADFLRRYLSIFNGFLTDLDVRAFERRALLDPDSAPPEILPWLSTCLGLVLDERWPVEAKRTFVKEAVWLFRFRGTIAGLRRFLEIYLERQIIIIEHFRARGLGGALVGGVADLQSSSVLGAGFRVGGAVGTTEEVAVVEQQSPEDALREHAHRFTVVIPMGLDGEQADVVRTILDVHRPAHTVYEICTVDLGMRVGVGLYVDLTSVVGATAGFSELKVGRSLLGRNAVLGRRRPGTRPGSSRVGGDSRIG